MERTRAVVQAGLERLVGRCREKGMNVTPQRMAVYKALLESEEHPTPEMLYKKVRRALPSISLATIYKALDALEALELVRAVEVDSESRRYDANMNRHHHLVCTRCRRVVDFYDDRFNRLRPTRTPTDFTPELVSVKVLGVCGRCS